MTFPKLYECIIILSSIDPYHTAVAKNTSVNGNKLIMIPGVIIDITIYICDSSKPRFGLGFCYCYKKIIRIC